MERPNWYHNMSSVTQAGLCVRTNQLDFDDEVTFAAERAIYDFARTDDKRPFLLVASLTHPHDPSRSLSAIGISIATTRSTCRARRSRAKSSIRIRCACAMSARWTRETVTEREYARCAPRLLRRDLLCRRQSRPADGGPCATPGSTATRSSSSSAITAKCSASAALVQDEFLRRRRARPAGRQRAASALRRAASPRAFRCVDVLPTLVDFAGGDSAGAGRVDRRTQSASGISTAPAAMTKPSANISPKARSRRS